MTVYAVCVPSAISSVPTVAAASDSERNAYNAEQHCNPQPQAQRSDTRTDTIHHTTGCGRSIYMDSNNHVMFILYLVHTVL